VGAGIGLYGGLGGVHPLTPKCQSQEVNRFKAIIEAINIFNFSILLETIALVANPDGLQFFTRLGSVFAEEVGAFM
tara:strand:+ start:454 stop:681 length:228 start_codon:yes stop_codon:yes gene_type:complete